MVFNPRDSRFRRRTIVAGAYVAGLVVVVGTWILVFRDSAKGADKADVVLVVSGDTSGWITPCGCTVNQSGGLPRRATYLADLARTHAVLYADVGGTIDGTSPYHILKAQAIFRGESQMNIAAQNLGAAELALGSATLRQLEQQAGVPFICANVADAAGAPAAPATRVVSAGKLRVAFIGVISPQFAAAPWHIEEPRQAILRAIDAIKGQYDRLIVLAYVDEGELEALARDLPEVDAVIGGPTGQSVPPHRIGAARAGAAGATGGGPLVCSATRQGKFVVEAALQGDRRARIVELNGTFADSPGQLLSVTQFHDDLRRMDFAATDTGMAPGAARQGTFAGSQSCQSCHTQAFAIWTAMAHAHAGLSLRQKGSDADPSCQVCHTTGYGAPGGFLSLAATPARFDVGCEDCHGPSQAHVLNPQIRTPFLAKAQCISCHDQENSPDFDFASSWAKIRHGSEIAAGGGGAHP